MKKLIIFMAMIIFILSISCENSVVTEEVPFEVSMLYPPTLYNEDTLSVVLKFSENDTTITSTDDIKILIRNKGISDSLTIIGLLRKNEDNEEEIGYYKYHGINLLKGFGIIVQGKFLKKYSGVYELEVVIGKNRVQSKERLVITTKGI